jgi:hypothetical protein
MAMAGNKDEIASTSAYLYIKSYRKLLRVLVYFNILTLLLIFCIIYVIFFDQSQTIMPLLRVAY